MSQNIPPGASMLDVGWGRLIFAHTFPDASSVARALLDERPDRRDIAFYVNDPHLILNEAPQDLFLDPSNTYRLNLAGWFPPDIPPLPFRITTIERDEDVEEINRIYQILNMVPLDPDVILSNLDSEQFQYYVVRPHDSDRILGVTLGVDHNRCFDDLFNSCSLWALGVDPQAEFPGVGIALVRHVAAVFADRGRAVLDLSVLDENEVATKLYEGLGFERVPVLAIKRRNQINEHLFIPQHSQEGFNPYASILINEALRRGIAVEPLDPPRGYFRLSLGNRRVTCRESLTDMTSAIAMCRCADKQLTREILDVAGLATPDQETFVSDDAAADFLRRNRRVVVKPAEGEQGHGVFVDLQDTSEISAAVREARRHGAVILMEQFVEGQDLRIIVINFEVVAAAVRKPAEIVGTGRHTVRKLLEKASRRRSAATGGESRIPLDDETQRCVQSAGFAYDDIPEEGHAVRVRRTANLHTGGTIHDVTSELSPVLAAAAVEAARALEIPVVGLDFIVPDVGGEEYVIIEANERPGLANHEPAPTAERFIDLLFPHTSKQIPASEHSA